MEAGAQKLNQSRVLVPAGMNEGGRSFCHHCTNCRPYTGVALQVANEARNLSPFKNLKDMHWSVVRVWQRIKSRIKSSIKCKNRDKFIYFSIVRVICRLYF